MERQARFVLMGSFVLAFALAIFGSVYWLHGLGTFGATTIYTVRFEGGAPGIGVGRLGVVRRAARRRGH